MADIYDKKQAENILNSCIPKTLRKLFRIEKVSKEIPNTKPPSKEVVRKNTGKALETEEIQGWISKIEDLNGLAGDARVRKNELSVLNIILSKKINDFLSEEVIKEIKGLDNRTYTPKALGELFDF